VAEPALTGVSSKSTAFLDELEDKAAGAASAVERAAPVRTILRLWTAYARVVRAAFDRRRKRAPEEGTT
jgi:hypothetical protein